MIAGTQEITKENNLQIIQLPLYFYLGFNNTRITSKYKLKKVFFYKFKRHPIVIFLLVIFVRLLISTRTLKKMLSFEVYRVFREASIFGNTNKLLNTILHL